MSDSTAADKGAFLCVIRGDFCYTVDSEHGRVWIQKGAVMKTLWQEFLQGLSAAFDFGPGAYARPDFLASPKSDMDALVGDWEALCEDGRKAFGSWREVYHV